MVKLSEVWWHYKLNIIQGQNLHKKTMVTGVLISAEATQPKGSACYKEEACLNKNAQQSFGPILPLEQFLFFPLFQYMVIYYNAHNTKNTKLWIGQNYIKRQS